VERQWFANRKYVDVQYFRLVKRVQAFYQTEEGQATWSQVEGYYVYPVLEAVGRSGAALRTKFQQAGAGSLNSKILCGLVHAFLHDHPRQFFMNAASIRRVGFSTAARGNRAQKAIFRGTVGSVACTCRPSTAALNFHGKIIRVAAIKRVVDPVAVSTSLDVDRRLNEVRQEAGLPEAV
jgi:hypothetical protein